MTDDGLFGDRLVKLFPMIQRPNLGVVRSLQRGTFAAVRMTYSGTDRSPTLPSPCDEAFALCLRLRHQRAEAWVDGRHARKGVQKGETSVYDLRCETIVRFHDPFDFLYLYLPHNALSELAAELGISRIQYEIATGTSIFDPIVAQLGARLLPAVEKQTSCLSAMSRWRSMLISSESIRAAGQTDAISAADWLLGSFGPRKS